jgi:saccharopine dehydrogenase-like NADP-dependent oxidoreductase
MTEKTLRYPGHAEKMRLLRDTGLFSTEPVEIDGQEIRPIDVTTSLLFPLWQLKEGEEDVTVMRIAVEGVKADRRTRYTYDLADRFDRTTGTTSMARTTGYAASAAARLLAAGLYREPGVVPPEFIGRDARCVDRILDDLRDRGIEYRESIATID